MATDTRSLQDEELGIDFSDLERKYAVTLDEGLESFVVVDGAPKAPEAKVPVLTKVLKKLFSSVGTIKEDGFHMPVENGATKGFLFIEYENAKQAAEAIKTYNHKRLDAKHTLLVNKLSDVERFGNDETITEDFVSPAKTEFKPREHLRSWLTDSNAREQLFTHSNETITINWFKKTEEPKVAGTLHKVVEGPARWSPHGNYLATMYNFGVQLNGGSSFNILAQFLHYSVKAFHFSPNEKFLVTFSDSPIGSVNENDPENPKVPFSEQDIGNQVVVWDVLTQLPLRSFPLPTNGKGEKQQISWPILKWSADSKYFARVTPGEQLSIYEAHSMGLLDKKSIKISGIVDFAFAPTSVQPGGKGETEQILCYWTPEIGNQAARVSIMSVPSKQVIRTRNLFNVSDCKFHWHDQGKYLCVKVDRHTRTKKQIFTNLEFFKITEKDIPVEVIELKDVVINFAWEPKGDRFIVVSRNDVPANEKPAPNSNKLSFYGLERKKNVQGGWKVIQSFDKKNTTSIYWSPKGRFVVTSNFGVPGASQAVFEFWDFETEAKDDNTSPLVHIVTSEYYGIVDLEWDPSGRYIALWSIKNQPGYKLLKFNGDLLFDKGIDYFRGLTWRPRPATVLSAKERRNVLKNLKDLSARFDEEDAMDADAAVRILVTKRRDALAYWRKWRKEITEKLHNAKFSTEEEILKELESGSQVVEEVREEIIEETEEIID
ncbi:hypothetical protein D0Z03_002126 [Geotrichum reessii]|nr:hypothetical protein D0Z03_002126 [Galactomyces reessii]